MGGIPLDIGFTKIQQGRLIELGYGENGQETKFESALQRDARFREIENALKQESLQKIQKLQTESHRPALIQLRSALETALWREGFMQVATPTVITNKMLEKMTITPDHPLYKQVFWIGNDKNKCLRPMLAPNLYSISKDLMRLLKMPLRIFEIGSCFRRESQGSNHLNEFTMLNLVEWGTPNEERVEHIKEFARIIMEAAGIRDYKLEKTDCVVYGDTVDVTVNGMEVASSSMGPHFLDSQWRVTCTWVGIGFGLERLLMAKNGAENIHRYGRSISYLDGVRLKL